jgi:predicted transcriptional regulator of viral defense system
MRADDALRLLADLAQGQWGMVTAPQARTAGITYVRLTRMTQAGDLRRVAHGIYLLEGSPPDEHVELRAAWLGLDPGRRAIDRLGDGTAGSVVSHFSAAAMHGLAAPAARHEFIVPGRKQSRRKDVGLHRSSLSAEDVTASCALPVTTVQRLIVDLIADGADIDRVAEVYARAAIRGGVDTDDLCERLQPYAARRGFTGRDGIALMSRLAAARLRLETVDSR